MTTSKYWKITYFDPTDPKGRKIKTWRFKSKQKAKEQQDDLKVAWDERTARNFPIKRS